MKNPKYCFVWNLIPSTSCKFYYDDFIIVTPLVVYLEQDQSLQYFAQQFSFTTRQVLNNIES